MTGDAQRPGYIAAAEAGTTPRVLTAWRAMLAVVADGEWHSRKELETVAISTGIALCTAKGILRDARRTNRLDVDNPQRPMQFRLPAADVPW